MGAVELKFSGSFERSEHLKDFQCPCCDKFIAYELVITLMKSLKVIVLSLVQPTEWTFG
jgi:hypothetical protein